MTVHYSGQIYLPKLCGEMKRSSAANVVSEVDCEKCLEVIDVVLKNIHTYFGGLNDSQ